MKLACCCALGKEVTIAVFNLYSRLANVVVNGIGPEWTESCSEPQDVVTFHKTSIPCKTVASKEESSKWVSVPSYETCGLLVTLVVKASTAQDRVELCYLSVRDVT